MNKLSVALLTAVSLTAVASAGGVVSADAKSSTNTSAVQPRDVSIFTRGNITASGSIVENKGMTIDSSGKTSGTLALKYVVTDSLNIDLGDHTYTYFKVPTEFQDLMDGTDITKYISGIFTYKTLLGGTKDKIYQPDDIKVVGDHLIRVDNGRHLGSVASQATSEIAINLGKAVTESKIRIPDASPIYTFHATTTTTDTLVNWAIVGNSDASTMLSNIPKIDPGYGYENNKPVVNDIYDTDNLVTGTGTPGATINVYNNNDELIGHGTVKEDGSYSVKIESKYLPLAVDDEIHVTQNTGLGESKQTVTHVKQKGTTPSASATHFQTGYWSDSQSDLVIEGRFVNSAFDFGKSSNTSFAADLVNSRGEVVYPVSAATTDWYTAGMYDGYQFLIPTSALSSASIVPSGTYTIKVRAQNTNGTDSAVLSASNNKARYVLHHAWNEIESMQTGGRTITFTTGPNNEALINIK
jgi:hypothetical protein